MAKMTRKLCLLATSSQSSLILSFELNRHHFSTASMRRKLHPFWIGCRSQNAIESCWTISIHLSFHPAIISVNGHLSWHLSHSPPLSILGTHRLLPDWPSRTNPIWPGHWPQLMATLRILSPGAVRQCLAGIANWRETGKNRQQLSSWVFCGCPFQFGSALPNFRWITRFFGFAGSNGQRRMSEGIFIKNQAMGNENGILEVFSFFSLLNAS